MAVSIKNKFYDLIQTLKAKPHIAGVPAAAIAVFLLVMRIFTVRPAIMQDEYIYARYARQLPMSEAPIPDYLFYWVFGATKSCGPNFYSCAKSINILFFLGIALVLYLIAVKYVSKSSAWFVSVAFLFSPIGTYASFFMPEMMFFFFSVLFLYFLLGQTWNSSYKSWIALGLLLGIASLTKPHALFLAFPIAIFIIYIGKNSGEKYLWDSFLKVTAVGIGSLISKFSLGFVFAGLNGISLFGSSYSGTISATATGITNPVTLTNGGAKPAPSIADLLGLFFGQLWGHSSAIALLLLAPIVIGITLLAKGSEVDFGLRKFAVLVLSSIVTGIVSISLFTALITFNGADHSSRVMIRYYDYVVPLAITLVALAFSIQSSVKSRVSYKTLTLIAIVMLIAFVGVISGFAPFKTSFLDGTSFNAVSSSPALSWVALAIFVAFILTIVSKRKKFLPHVATLVVVTLTFGLNGATAASLKPSSGVDQYDAAASFASHYLSQEELSALTVIASEDYPLARTLFLIDNPRVDYRIVEKGATFGSKFLDDGKEWVMLIGETFIDGNSCLRLPGSGFILQKMCNSRQYYFNQATPNTVISELSGFGIAEHWGAWTVGNNSVITFAHPLPTNAKIKITMSIPNYNSDQTLSATVGDSTIEFQLTEDVIDGEFEFENGSPTNTLKIHVPAPKSENSEGVSVNQRPVGIKMFALEVVN